MDGGSKVIPQRLCIMLFLRFSISTTLGKYFSNEREFSLVSVLNILRFYCESMMCKLFLYIFVV